MRRKGKVTVAFSGGKDSTAAVLILRERGHDVRAVTMRLGTPFEKERLHRIHRLARHLDLPLQEEDLTAQFRRRVVSYFVRTYRRGGTPNPCAICNAAVKFGILRDRLGHLGADDAYATGHYAATAERNGAVFLIEPRERRKSQIYFLSLVGRARLQGSVFPLADHTLEEVRSMVDGLPLADPKESQDVCFLQDVDLMAYLRRRTPELFRPGAILNTAGEVIGAHDGVVYFTIGQRRGIRFSSARKLYVVAKDVAANTITLGEDRDLHSESLDVAQPLLWRPLRVGETLTAKVRYQGRAAPVRIVRADRRRVSARFDAAVRAVTPGQIAVFYDGDLIAAAGRIV